MECFDMGKLQKLSRNCKIITISRSSTAISIKFSFGIFLRNQSKFASHEFNYGGKESETGSY